MISISLNFLVIYNTAIMPRHPEAMAACAGLVALHLSFPMMLDIAESAARNVDVAEIFCGVGSVWRAGASLGLNCQGFDKDISEEMNVLTTTGLEAAVRLVASVREGGLVMISPDCGSFCGLCTAQTQRCAGNPSGNESREKVRNGNVMATVAVMLLVLAWVRDSVPLLENPSGNFFWSFPPVVQVFQHIPMWKAILCRCRFSSGNGPKKPFCLAGPAPWVEELNFPCNHSKEHEKLAKVEYKDGKKQVNGKRILLKQSGSYPPKMGRVIIQVWRKHALQAMQEPTARKTAASMDWKKCADDDDDEPWTGWKQCAGDSPPSSSSNGWKNSME